MPRHRKAVIRKQTKNEEVEKRAGVFVAINYQLSPFSALACAAAATWNTPSPPCLPGRLLLTPDAAQLAASAQRHLRSLDTALHGCDPRACPRVSVQPPPSPDCGFLWAGAPTSWPGATSQAAHHVQRLRNVWGYSQRPQHKCLL